ncbi:hypothetical protein KR074_004074 [Drosophila pseudoananassae]|nr:hypothetical protein KR074_004074 [Drosophila pseudoananassae]
MEMQAILQQMYSGGGGMPMMMQPYASPSLGMGLNGNAFGVPMPHPFNPFGTPPSDAFDQAGEDLDDDDDEDQRTLFCGNLDERVTEEILYEVFLQAGPIEHVRIPVDKMGGRQRNFGFVTYQHQCAVPFALDLYQGLELFEKKVTIRPQGADKPKPQANFPQGRLGNPLAQESPSKPSPPHSARHGLHGAKPYDRHSGGKNGDQRRRSDSSVMERNRPRNHSQQHYQNQHKQGGSRRSDQRHNHQRRI